MVTGGALEVEVAPASPGSAEGRLVLGAYFGDVISRRHGRRARLRGNVSGNCVERETAAQ